MKMRNEKEKNENRKGSETYQIEWHYFLQLNGRPRVKCLFVRELKKEAKKVRKGRRKKDLQTKGSAKEKKWSGNLGRLTNVIKKFFSF